ncbi:MAG TPA: hypothetical protein VFD58_20455 [Blastocatellia bacterium]|nr:hypothetical protein [Blastocatellia bacterium]
MKWARRGLICTPTGDWWAKSHAYLPTAELMEGGYIRVYYTSLDADKVGRIGYIDLDAGDPGRILYQTNEPIFDIGEPGAFDDSGVNASCVVQGDRGKYLYYIGWQRADRVPYMLFAGLAISDDSGGSFVRYSRAPVLERTAEEPFTRSATTVIVEDGIFRAWYVSALRWIDIDKVKYPSYVIRLAVSTDGIHWSRTNPVCIDFETEDEFGFGRPWVIKDGGVYRMWYSIRSTIRPYRLGYAESENGLEWVRKDNGVGIEASESGWDSEMICFPCVVDVGGRRYLFYNGNRHGEGGFGYAVLESE